MAKKDDMMNYLLYAAAAYVGYRWAVGQGMIPDYIGLGPLDFGNLFGAPAMQPQVQTVVDANGNATQVVVDAPVAPPVVPTPPVQDQGTGGDQGSGTNTGPGGSGGGGGDIQSQTRNAALNVSNQRGGKMNWWEWNYYLPANIARPDWWFTPMNVWGSTPLGRKPANAEEAASVQLTFDQWWELGSPLIPGLSGLGMGYVNHWGQQPSASRWII